MTPSEQCLSLIKSFEGFRSKAYKCSAGKWTIGYGSTSGVKEGDTISEEEALEKLKIDAQIAADSVNALVGPKLNQNQFDALVCFVYNVGHGNFSKSTLLRRLNDGRWEMVPDEMRRWKYVNGNPSIGLIKRRAREVSLFTKPPQEGMSQ